MSERFDVDFDAYFADALDRLDDVRDAGFVDEDEDTLRVTDRGRLFVRNVCMEFDRYLMEKQQKKAEGEEEEETPVFSRTV